MSNNKFFIVGFFIVFTYCIYSPVLKNDFINYDDPEYVYENPHIKDLAVKNIQTLFNTRTSDLYIPLVFLSYNIEYHFFKLKPTGYHFTNLILHIINSLLVLWLVWLLSKNLLITIIISIFFAIHPLHVESVAWITERKDLLYSFFYLIALISYHFYNQRNDKKYYVLAFVCFLFSCFSKAMAITLPAILILYDYFYLQKKSWKIIINKIPFFIISMIFVIVAFKMMNMEERWAINFQYNPLDKIATFCYGLFFYIQKAIIPVHLSLIYPYPQKTEKLLPLIYLVSPIIIGIITWLVFFYSKSNSIIKSCFLFFLISILPVLQIIPNTFTIAADRYFYLPSIGLFAIAAYLLNTIVEQKKLKISFVWTLLTVTTIIFSSLTYNRCKVWNNSITLFTDVIQHYQTSDVAYGNLGSAYNSKGDFITAIPFLQKAAELNPENPKVLNDYGCALCMVKQYDKAIENFNRAIVISPQQAQAYNNLANTYGVIGKTDLAIDNYIKTLQRDPDNAKALYNLGVTYSISGNKKMAIESYQHSAQLGFQRAQEFLQKNGLNW